LDEDDKKFAPTDPFEGVLMRVQMNLSPCIKEFNHAMLLDPTDKNSLQVMQNDI
jgi:hypothetical protein